MAKTPLQEVREERRELEQFRADVLSEIHSDAIKLDDKCSLFDGHRSVDLWKGDLESEMQLKDLDWQELSLQEQIDFKNKQILEDDIVEVDKRYKDELKPLWLLGIEIKSLELQKEGLKVQRKIVLKEKEIRALKKKQDKELIEKHAKGD